MGSGTQSDVTHELGTADQGGRQAAVELLPLVYDELRRLAHAWLARTPPGQTLQPTALVHEAYLRLVGGSDPGWEGRRHFFGAAAQSMRQIMVDEVRRRKSLKRGGDWRRVSGEHATLPIGLPDDDLLALDEALDRMEHEEERSHRVVMLKFFAGLTSRQAAQLLEVSERTIEREWQFARAWLHRDIAGLS